MLLINKTQRIIHLSEVNKENSMAAPTLITVIGTIELDDKRWAAIKGSKDKPNKVVMDMLDEGWLEEVFSKPADAIKDMKPKEAIEAVQSTTDVALLALWKKGEKRKPVLRAIQAQEKRLAGESVEDDAPIEDAEDEGTEE